MKKQTLINGKLISMGCHERGAGSMERGVGWLVNCLGFKILRWGMT